MDADQLKSWIHDYRVCWEMHPHVELRGERRLHVGYDLTLFARHPTALGNDPGLEASGRCHDVLREIAAAVIPKEPRPMLYEVAPFDTAVHLRLETNWEPEAELDVAILQRDGAFSELDQAERRCATEIQKELGRLGVRHGTWPAVESLNRDH
jgi:hypothetical protein